MIGHNTINIPEISQVLQFLHCNWQTKFESEFSRQLGYLRFECGVTSENMCHVQRVDSISTLEIDTECKVGL